MLNSEILRKLKDFERESVENSIEDLSTEFANCCEWKEQNYSEFRNSKSAEESKLEFKKKLKSLLDNTAELQRIKEGMDTIFDQLKIKPGGKACLIELERASKTYFEELSASIDSIQDFVKENLPSKSQSKKADSFTFSSLASHLGISNETMRVIYEIGNEFYTHKKYQEALSIFQVLNHLDYSSHVIWVSLGICFQQIKDYYHAIYAYTMASLTKPSDLQPYLYSCECFLALNNHEQAKGCIELAKHFKELYHNQEHMKRIEELQRLVNV